MNKNKYQSNSLSISSWLISKGFPLLQTKKENNKTTFIFNHSPEIEQSVDHYFSGGNVSAIKFWESIRILKSRIYQA